MPRVIITVPEKNPQPYRFQLDRKVVSLGRGSDNDIVIDSGSVSGKHAEMHRVEGGYELADLGSTNGIKYDGTRQQVISLRSGMSVRLGDVSFDFTLSEEELEALGREKPTNEPPIMKENASVAAAPPKEEEPPRRSVVRKPPAPPAPAGVSFGMILLFLVLAACAFYAGLDIRHRKESGESLIKGIVNKSEAQQPAAGSGGKAE
jgi:pSer/pThr/pTyr-binding forkhead associated (FHA) protein